MRTVEGHILSTMGKFSTVGGYPDTCGGGYHEYCRGVQYSRGHHLLLFEYLAVLNIPTILMIPPHVS